MTVTLTEGKYRINDQDVLLYGGELHYFRIPRSDWEQRIDLLIDAGCNLISTYVPWIWHEYEEGAFDFTGETVAERDLQRFLELAAAKGLYCLVRPGPYIMAEVRNEGVPSWLLEQYPEVIAKQQNGEDHPARVVAYMHPLFLEKVKRWYEAVNAIIAPQQISHGGPVVTYQLCNEIGMLHWVTNTSDYNEATLHYFIHFLENKYGSIALFNEAYGLDAPSFAAFVDTFKTGLTEDHPSFHWEWGLFWRTYIKDYAEVLRSLAIHTGINVPFLINVHGFKNFSMSSRGVDYPIGLSQLYEAAGLPNTLMAGDFYPGHIGHDTYHDLALSCEFTKAISSPEQPLFSAEFQSGRLQDRPRLYPQDLDLNTRTCVAHGMNAINYYMFAAGENPDDIGIFGRRHDWQAPINAKGDTQLNYDPAQHLGRMFQTIGSQLVNAEKRAETYIGFDPDNYMTEFVDPRDADWLKTLEVKREEFAYEGILRLLTIANIHYRAVDLHKPIEPERVPSLWVFATEHMAKDLQQRLADYVKAGGYLVLYPEIPLWDRHGRPCTVLQEALQLGQWEHLPGNDYLDVLGVDSVNVKQRLAFHKNEGKRVAVFQRNGSDETAAYTKQVGDGTIMVLGFGIRNDFDYQVEVIQELAREIGISPAFTSSNAELSIVQRKNDQTSFVFVTNYDDIQQSGVIYEQGKALFDGIPVTLPHRSSVLCLQHYPLTDGVMIDYATVELERVDEHEDRLLLMVKPVGDGGAIAFTHGSDWSIHTEADLRDIHETTTIELRRNGS
ncbi:beta-galactosidase [Thalassobacillus sp. CUG 92003]|uniref:beta-galactosidase n=1 Tax=Thalassobacillus sp. CUG 92003 TaxID=2736641 RepID=UPI0015E6559C|nr:beta-galactosidase [Thalassobacillus sp. CUG 92003]